MRELVTCRTISEIVPIEGADAIELIKIDGWQCIAKKNQFKVNETVLFFEIDSLLPMIPQFEFLKPRGTKKMLINQQEYEGYRLRTIRLRGQLSQGLALPLADFPQILIESLLKSDVRCDLAAILGVIKYEQPIPAQLQGTVKGTYPSFIAKTDQERVQNLNKELTNLAGRAFEVTEKLDGSSMTAFLRDGEFGVCSRNMELKETEGNTFWRVARELDLENKLKAYGKNIALQGELVGPGVQGNYYKLSNATCYFYDVYNIDLNRQLIPAERDLVMTDLGLQNNIVPVLEFTRACPADISELLALAEGDSLLWPMVKREGVVLKSHENLAFNETAPFHFKVISNSFLLDEK